MKKYLLSAAVVISFVVYSFALRQNDDAKAPIAAAPDKKSVALHAYRDGRYLGPVTDAFYGKMQVEVTVEGGKITDTQMVQYPDDQPNSIEINKQAMTLLRQEVITAQSAHVDIVSGATQTSEAFSQSLAAALTKAQN